MSGTGVINARRGELYTKNGYNGLYIEKVRKKYSSKLHLFGVYVFLTVSCLSETKFA